MQAASVCSSHRRLSLCSPPQHAALGNARHSARTKKAHARSTSVQAGLGGLQLVTPTLADVGFWLLDHPAPTLVLAIVLAVVIPRILKVVWRAIVIPAVLILAGAAIFDSPQSAWSGLTSFSSGAAGFVTAHPQWVSLFVIGWLALQLSTRVLPLVLVVVGLLWLVAPSKVAEFMPKLPSFPGSGLVTRMLPNPFAADSRSSAVEKSRESENPASKRFRFSDNDASAAPDGIFSGLRRRAASARDSVSGALGGEDKAEQSVRKNQQFTEEDSPTPSKGIFAGARRRLANARDSVVDSDRAGNDQQSVGKRFQFSDDDGADASGGIMSGLRKRAASVRELL